MLLVSRSYKCTCKVSVYHLEFIIIEFIIDGSVRKKTTGSPRQEIEESKKKVHNHQMQEHIKQCQPIRDDSMKLMWNFTYLGRDLTEDRKCDTKIRTFIELAKKKKEEFPVKKGSENRKSDIECWENFELMKQKMDGLKHFLDPEMS